jgi:hydroxymethylpyrimidine/phosphomethylpyrimidine kinase
MDRGDSAGVSLLPIALTIAGSDSGAGAGIQADLKTFAALGVYGASVITAITAQNTLSVHRIHFPSPEMVRDQIDATLEDFSVAAIKIGMLGTAEIGEVVAGRLAVPRGRGVRGEGRRAKRDAVDPDPHPADYVGHLLPGGEGRAAFIVYDPVMTASTGDPLSGASFAETIRARLLPLVDCLTPNLMEAAALLGEPVARSEAHMARQGAALLELGPCAILMKGGHLEGDEAVDLLVTADAVQRFAAPRLESKNLHGTGCTLSSAIAAYRVLGMQLPEAVAAAKVFVRAAIERGRDVALGAGPGPLIQTPLATIR